MPDFLHAEGKRKDVKKMKVLIHLKRGRTGSYLLSFKGSDAARRVKAILGDSNQDRVLRTLLMKSTKRVEVASEDRRKAEASARFVVSRRGYTAERLA